MKNHIYPISDQLVSRAERERFFNQRGHVFWLTGLSGSGKSTIAKGAERQLFDKGYTVKVLDGDNMRTGLCSNLSFSIEDRAENIRRVSETAKLLLDSGIIVLCSFISPTVEIRAMAEGIIGKFDFSEVYVSTSLVECERRDTKGLYAKARSSEIKRFTGINSPYETPTSPACVIDTKSATVQQSIEQLLIFAQKKIQL